MNALSYATRSLHSLMPLSITKGFAVTSPLIFIVILTLLNLKAVAEPALVVRPMLTLDVAQEIARVCQARQISNQRPPVTIAIFDQGANLVLFHRMTGAALGATAVAMEKGKSTANYPVSTRQWAGATYGEKGSLSIAFVSNITTITGGVPIMTPDGVHLGGIGVSGSTSDDDEACALAGLDAVKKYLVAEP